MTSLSPSQKFRQALNQEAPLQIIGTINAYCAMMAQRIGFRSIYLSGAGCANFSYGLPDLGITNLNDVLADVSRITSACDLPLLVDIDTGWGNAFSIARTIQQMIKAGAAAVHLEDQVTAKRCGHRPGKELVEPQEMVDRIRAAVDAKTDNHFFIIARTDALASEGISSAMDRASRYIEAGADAIFAEAVTDLSQYQQFSKLKVPILANITEFGKTPLFTLEELKNAGVNMVLYPLSAARMMNAAACNAYLEIRHKGTQRNLISQMQNRETLYDFLNYYQYEEKLDQLFKVP